MKYVYVLTEETDDGTTVVGVYETHESAVAEKNAIIRDWFDIDESEITDDRLDEEVSDSVTYDIFQRRLIE